MRALRRSLPVLALALVALGVLTAPAGAKTRHCGEVQVRWQGREVGGTVSARHAGCSEARHVIRYALTHRSGGPMGPDGWSCRSGRHSGPQVPGGGPPTEGGNSLICHRVGAKGRAWLPGPPGLVPVERPHV